MDGFRGDYVCTKLLFNECYHMLGEPDRKNIGEINDIMNNTIEGWIPGPQHRFDRYGQQRSWVRVKTPDKEKADTDCEGETGDPWNGTTAKKFACGSGSEGKTGGTGS